MPQASAEESPVGPLERGLLVLRALGRAPGGRLAATALVRGTGLARSPVDRIVGTLLRLGYVREEDRDIVLAPPLLALGGRPARDPTPARSRRHGSRGRSTSRCRSRCRTARPYGSFAQHTRRRALSVSFRVGDALPADRCAPGALFAGDWPRQRYAAWEASPAGPEEFPALPDADRARVSAEELRGRAAAARERGWALDDQFIEPGLVALAVPVRDGGGRVAAALSAVSHTSRHSPALLRETALAPLRETAAAMEAALAAPVEEVPVPPVPAADPTAEAKRELGPGYLQSLARGLAVLASLGGAPGGMSLAAVARATDLPRATARRSLLTLEQLGYVASRDGLFTPLPQVLALGHAPLSRLSVGELAQPHLAALVSELKESASLAVLDGGDIRYVARVAASRIMSVTITLGTRFPAHATSMGRVLLAGLTPEEREQRLAAYPPRPLTSRTVTEPEELRRILDEVARDGYALVDQELEEGLRSVAAPVRAADGRVVAAVNVSLHADRTSATEARTTVLPALRATAERITADVRATGATEG
ncbi:IclR family transcriptional regulator domain-containing protein [Streptomyces sp. SPB78]|uniref:IclR family transcriptional regulator domain-containing protein n=1 Tax=Streptomyces sp. (strain SPB78) TaxID=591157 RepID=UPI0001B5380A|nr:IclR family transcriptional regulator C-terminal domain-containing protein [Streptomyces sp. SPB78]